MIRSVHASIASLKVSVRASQIELENVRQQPIDTRTAPDVLNAEREVFADLVQLAKARTRCGYRPIQPVTASQARDGGQSWPSSPSL